MNNITLDAIYTLYSASVKILKYLITDEALTSHQGKIKLRLLGL